MLKALFIIATILIAVVLATQPAEDGEHHHHQHVGQHNGQVAEQSKHHIQAGDKEQEQEQVRHGRVNVPIAPHHSKGHRNGRRHKTSKSAKGSKSHHHHHQQQHPKASNHHKKHSRRGHGRKHQ